MAEIATLILLAAVLVVAVLLLRAAQSTLAHIKRMREVEDMTFVKDLRHRAELKASHRRLENENARLGELETKLRAERNEARDLVAQAEYGPDAIWSSRNEPPYKYWAGD